MTLDEARGCAVLIFVGALLLLLLRHSPAGAMDAGAKRTQVRDDMVRVDFPGCTWRQLLEEMRDGLFAPHGDELVAQLRAGAFDSYYFEAPDLRRCLDRPVTFVLVRSRSLHRRTPSWSSFAEHLPGTGVFENLGRDATLVVPANTDGAYGHLRAFVATAPEEEVRDLFQKAATEALRRHGASESESVFLSTAGDGVPWLHVRVSRVPKYYTALGYLESVCK